MGPNEDAAIYKAGFVPEPSQLGTQGDRDANSPPRLKSVGFDAKFFKGPECGLLSIL